MKQPYEEVVVKVSPQFGHCQLILFAYLCSASPVMHTDLSAAQLLPVDGLTKNTTVDCVWQCETQGH